MYFLFTLLVDEPLGSPLYLLFTDLESLDNIDLVGLTVPALDKDAMLRMGDIRPRRRISEDVVAGLIASSFGFGCCTSCGCC